MHAFQEIQDTLARLEANLSEPLDIRELARAAHLSPYYFQRLFTRLVGRTLAEYQKQRRLARSLDDLRAGDACVLDVALKWGFGSHEVYTRAFREAFSLTPEAFRRQPEAPLTPVLVPDVTMRYRLVDEGVPLVADGVVLEISRRVYQRERLYAGFVQMCPRMIPNGLNPGRVWDFLGGTPMRTMPRLHPQGSHAGISGGGPEGMFSYLAGCEVLERDTAFEGARAWPGFGELPGDLSTGYAALPPGEYLICTFTAESFSALVVEALHKVLRYFYGTHMPNAGLRAAGPLIEYYDERCLRWHPKYRPEDDAPHFLPAEPRLSQWEGPEMEVQVLINPETDAR